MVPFSGGAYSGGVNVPDSLMTTTTTSLLRPRVMLQLLLLRVLSLRLPSLRLLPSSKQQSVAMMTMTTLSCPALRAAALLRSPSLPLFLALRQTLPLPLSLLLPLPRSLAQRAICGATLRALRAKHR